MSAAGSGKTWGICNEALSVVSDQSKHVLIMTYTNKGVDTVNIEIEKQNGGMQSYRIVVRSWFQFLMTEMLKPYQSFIIEINKLKSFDFSDRYDQVNYRKKGDPLRYLSSCRSYVKKDNASELAVYLNKISNGIVVRRLEDIYSHIYIDEFQDMAGYDVDIVKLLFNSSVSITCVGDNKQATYATHSTRKNKKTTGKNLWNFCAEVQKKGLAVINESMQSRRFNNDICTFANSIYPNAQNATTCMTETTGHDGVFIIERANVLSYYAYFKPNVLKYDKRIDTCNLHALNFGVCKGMTFERVLIFTNGPLSGFLSGKKLKSPEKYYVAVTRPRFSLTLVVDKFPKVAPFEPTQINLGNSIIPALKYVVLNVED